MPLHSYFDADNRIGVVVVTGLLSEAERLECLAYLTSFAGRLRVAHGTVRLLIDAEHSMVQPQGMAAPVDVEALLSDPNDRMAIIINGALHAMQTRRVLNASSVGIFRDRADAFAWLGTNPVVATERIDP